MALAVFVSVLAFLKTWREKATDIILGSLYFTEKKFLLTFPWMVAVSCV
jgi:hypothetical protein